MGNSLEREAGEAVLAFRYAQFVGNNEFFRAILKLPPELLEAVDGSPAVLPSDLRQGTAGSTQAAPSARPTLEVSEELRAWLDRYLDEAEELQDEDRQRQNNISHSPPAERRRSALPAAGGAGAGGGGGPATVRPVGGTPASMAGQVREITEFPDAFRFQDLRTIVGPNLSAAVKRLNLCSQGLVEVTSALGLLGSHCQQLALCCNRLSFLPPEIGYLKNLTVLSISRNRLVHLPDTMAHLVNLKELSVSNNRLTTFNPVVASALTKLTDLSLHTNRITYLPPEMGKMQSLVQLNLAHNPLTALPAEIARLKFLRGLVLDRCPLASRKDWQIDSPLWEPPVRSPANRLRAVALPGDQGAIVPAASEFNAEPLWGGLTRMSRSSSTNNMMGGFGDQDINQGEPAGGNAGNGNGPGEPTSPNAVRRANATPVPTVPTLAPKLKAPLISLKEMCARVVVRHGIGVPTDFPDELRAYLASAKVCSFCSGPYFESYVLRAHFMIKGETWVPLVHTLCTAHWNTERERFNALFQPRPSTSPRVLSRSGSNADLHPPELPPISVSGPSGGAAGSGGGSVQGLKRSASALGSGLLRRLARSGSNLSISRGANGASRGELDVSNANPERGSTRNVAGSLGRSAGTSASASMANLQAAGPEAPAQSSSSSSSPRLARAFSLGGLNVARSDNMLSNVLSATRT
jgi:hypothetical protein